MTLATDPRPADESTRHRRLDPRRLIGPCLVILMGLSIFLYPVAATTWNNLKQVEAAHSYEQVHNTLPEDVIKASLESAEVYNSQLDPTGPILDPWLARISPDNTKYTAYLGELATQEAMARIIIPEAYIDLPVFHGTQPDVLKKGAGHLFGSALPIGGEGTHTVITGHSGLANATLFDNVKNLGHGDAIYLVAAGRKTKYVVDRLSVVLPAEPDDMRPAAGVDQLTLITCTPYGINTHRLLIHAVAAPLETTDEEAFEPAGIHIQWWMWCAIAAALLVVVALVWWIGSMTGLWLWLAAKRRRRDDKEQQRGDGRG